MGTSVKKRRRITFVPNYISSIHTISAFEKEDLPALFYSSAEIDKLLDDYVTSCLISKINGDSEIIGDDYNRKSICSRKNNIMINNNIGDNRSCGKNFLKFNPSKQFSESILRSKSINTRSSNRRGNESKNLKETRQERKNRHRKHQQLLLCPVHQPKLPGPD